MIVFLGLKLTSSIELTGNALIEVPVINALPKYETELYLISIS